MSWTIKITPPLYFAEDARRADMGVQAPLRFILLVTTWICCGIVLLWPMRMLCNALKWQESTSLVERGVDSPINALNLFYYCFRTAVQLANFVHSLSI
jgi:hypothetical protein